MNSFVLKAKQAIKKIAVLAGSAAFVGATVAVPVMAAGLEDLPSPFVTGNAWSGYVVYGSQGTDTAGLARDMAGAGNIIAGFGQSGTSTGDTVTVSGGKSKDLPINYSLDDTTYGFGADPLKDEDLEGLQDKEIEIEISDVQNDYDIHDEVRLGASATGLTGDIMVSTGLTTPAVDEDYGSDIFLYVETASLGYYYVFDDALGAGNYINDSTADDPITIDFMGRKLVITNAADADTLTAQIGDEYYMQVNDKVTVEGKTVTLQNVGSGGKVVVDVDGVIETLSGTDTVNGIEIYVSDTFYTDTVSERSATLVIGDEATDSYDDNERYINEDKDNPTWRWDIAGLDTASPTLGVILDIGWDDPEDNPPAVGDCIAFPDDFIKVCVDSLEVTKTQEYTFDGDGGWTTLYWPNGTSMHSTRGDRPELIRFHADGTSNEGFYIGGNYTDTILIYDAGTPKWFEYFWYDESDNRYEYAGNNATFPGTGAIRLTYEDTTFYMFGGIAADAHPNNASYPQTNYTITISEAAGSGGENITIGWYYDTSTTRYVLETSTDRSYLNYTDSDATLREIAGWETDTRTEAGTIIYEPDGNSYEITLGIPADDNNDFTVQVSVRTEKTTVTSATGGAAVNVVGASKIDADISTSTLSVPVVLIGGPVVNSLVADLGVAGKTMTVDDWRTDADADGVADHKDEAIIELVENAFGTNSALIIAGYDAKDTNAASNVLADVLSGGAWPGTLTGSKATLDTTSTTTADVTVK